MAAYGYPEVISILMARGGEVNVTDYHGSTPLHLGCQRGHQDVTLLLLAKGSLVSIEDNDGNRPLHLCCANGHEECVKALLYSTRPSQRVSINATNTRGDTALHLASRWGYANIVSLLIDHGASVEARNRRQETALMCSHNINISRTILFSTQDETDSGSMSSYATSPPIASILSTFGDEDNLVTPIKVSVTRLTKKLQPAQKEVEKLLRSVADGDILMMKHHLGWLSDDDYDDDDDDDDDNIPLDSKLCHPLCQCSKCAMLQKRTTISASGLSVNSHNQEGYTALHVAALHGHEAMVDVLLRRGAGVNQKDGSSQQCTPLHLACQCNHPKIVSKLLQHAAKCNIKDVRGNTPLHYCCLNGHLEPAEALLQHGANVNQTNQRGNTPLHEAARFNFTPLVKLLLDSGQANPHCKNKAQQIPLRLTQKRSEIAKMLKAAMRRDDDLESVTSTETNTSSGSSQTDPLESIRETGQSSKNSVPPPPLTPPPRPLNNDYVLPRPLSVHDLFNYFCDTDRTTMRALNQSIREFEPARQLRHVEVEDKHQENWNLYLKQQLEIQHFDRRKLRRAKTEDKSGPFFNMIKEELSNTSHIENSDTDSDSDDVMPESQEDYQDSREPESLGYNGNSVERRGDRTPNELDKIDRNPDGLPGGVGASSFSKRSPQSEDAVACLGEGSHDETKVDDQTSDLEDENSALKSETLSSDTNSAVPRSDDEHRKLENQSQSNNSISNRESIGTSVTQEDNVSCNEAIPVSANTLDSGCVETCDSHEVNQRGRGTVHDDAYRSNQDRGREHPGVECFKTPLSDSAINGVCQDEE